MSTAILKLDPTIQHVLWWDGEAYQPVDLAEVAQLREAARNMLDYYDADHGSASSEEAAVRQAVRAALEEVAKPCRHDWKIDGADCRGTWLYCRSCGATKLVG